MINIAFLVLLISAKGNCGNVPTSCETVGTLSIPFKALNYLTDQLEVIPNAVQSSPIYRYLVVDGPLEEPETAREECIICDWMRFTAWRALYRFRPLLHPQLGLLTRIGFDFVEGRLRPEFCRSGGGNENSLIEKGLSYFW